VTENVRQQFGLAGSNLRFFNIDAVVPQCAGVLYQNLRELLSMIAQRTLLNFRMRFHCYSIESCLVHIPNFQKNNSGFGSHLEQVSFSLRVDLRHGEAMF